LGGLLKGSSNVAKPELGSKRQCQSCGAKFFDLNKDPITCPKCSAVFQVAAVSRAPARAVQSDDDEQPEVVGAELVSLEEADAVDDKVVVPDDDIEIEDDGADETFLEEEEGDPDDVSGLIDSDLQDDEES
jgi:uncharacterized protein (TIGR02300 family)